MRGLLKFTLDLFDELATSTAPAASTAPARPARPARPTSPTPSRTKKPVAELPSAVGPSQPAIPLVDAVQPARFVHPRTTREITLGDARIGYEFARGKRRTIGFVVGAEGLTVRAPTWVPLRDVDAAVREKGDWILRKLAETQQRHDKLEAARIDWKDGVGLPFLGEPVVVRLDPSHAFDGIGAVLDPGTDGQPHTLRIALARDASAAQIRDAAQAWLMRQAKRIFIERLDHFAPLLNVRWTKLSLSNASTRWGSASADGAIRLHWRLVHFRMSVVDYVVAHELSHLRVMDHSQRFWNTVESVVPDYGTLRKQLKDQPVPRW